MTPRTLHGRATGRRLEGGGRPGGRPAPAPRGARSESGLAAAAVLAVLTAACAPQPGEENLKASFAAQIEAVPTVTSFAREGDELAFTETREGDSDVAWRVTIDSVALEPRPDEAVPFQGNVVSSWYADGELIEPIGSIYTLPEEFFDAGLAQDCWALWNAEQATWGW